MPDTTAVMGWMSAALVCFLGFCLFSKPLFRLGILFLRALSGISAIFVLDFLLSPVGISVGINFFTAAVSAVLGIPGITLLYGLAYLFAA